MSKKYCKNSPRNDTDFHRNFKQCLIPMHQRGNPYGIHSHAGAWEREKYYIIQCISVKIRGELLQNAFSDGV